MEYNEFKKMWIKIADKFKSEHPDWNPEKGDIIDNCSPEVLAFLDEIADCPKEKLGQLLGIKGCEK